MLPKKLRITKEKEIIAAFRTRFRHFDEVTKIYVSANSHQQFKLLVVVSKKISKKAHDRNRIKRKIHSVFEELHHAGRLPPSVSCAIQVTSKSIITMTRDEIHKQIIPSLSKVYVKMMT